MMRVFLMSTSCLVLLGCVVAPVDEAPVVEAPVVVEGDASEVSDLVRPRLRPDGLAQRVVLRTEPALPSGANTAETLDLSDAAEREEAVAPVEAAERLLGRTIVSLGAPAEQGFWLKTPLVSKETEGRVQVPGTEKSVQVSLIPIEGPDGAGSRMSLAALRLLEVPLTSLTEVEVYALK